MAQSSFLEPLFLRVNQTQKYTIRNKWKALAFVLTHIMKCLTRNLHENDSREGFSLFFPGIKRALRLLQTFSNPVVSEVLYITRLTDCWLNNMLLFQLFSKSSVIWISKACNQGFPSQKHFKHYTFSKMVCTVAGPISIMLQGCIVLHSDCIRLMQFTLQLGVIHNTGMMTNQSTGIESLLTQKGFIEITLELIEYYVTSPMQ